MLRLRAALAAAALIALLATPAASAHQGNVDYRSVIDTVSPDVSGLRLDVLNRDDRLELQNTTGRTIVIDGYEGEPYARLKADGTVEVNRRSPAFYLNDDRFGGVEVPKSADPKAAPQWQLIDRTGRLEWHDHRIHWMSKIPPKQVEGRIDKTKVFDWKVPLHVGDSAGAVRGTLFWQPPSQGGAPVAAIAGLGAIILLAAATVIVVRRRRRGETRVGEEAEAW
jgi:hypothetical protein